MMRLLLALLLALGGAPITFAADADMHLTPPKHGTIKVAFVMSEGATVIDFAGPWEVFNNVMLDGHGDDMDASMPFELYTVGPSTAPIHTSGSHHLGMTITPDYSFADAPTPDIVVIGAQSGGPGLSEWLQKVHAQDRIIMSVCTGAFRVAKAGLFDGLPATTHHAFFDQFSNQFPKVKLVESVRYVQASPTLFSAGGLTSGVDLALHVVDEYYGEAVAQKTADYMEYQSTGWKTNVGVPAPAAVAVHQEWKGDTASGLALLLHVTYAKGAYSALLDSASQGVTSAPTTVTLDGNHVDLGFGIPGHAATFTGTANDAGTVLTGTYVQDGKSSPLTLLKQNP
ncbi:MAG TPA: DJ-1/PfpI family protein [Gammaproteobacteria bacterium]|jgi:putative intracellular protease/amidase|nr:DJ-1/PfpI family protein [Gammaproteobacteria bacterium]